jgi:hypothetical protein
MSARDCPALIPPYQPMSYTTVSCAAAHELMSAKSATKLRRPEVIACFIFFPKCFAFA